MRNRRGDLRPRMLGHRETSVQQRWPGGSIRSRAVAGVGGRDDLHVEVSASRGGDEEGPRAYGWKCMYRRSGVWREVHVQSGEKCRLQRLGRPGLGQVRSI